MIRIASLVALALAICIQSPVFAAPVSSLTREGFGTATAGQMTSVETFDRQKTGLLKDTPGVGLKINRGDLVVTDRYLTTTGENGLGSGLSRQYFKPKQRITITFDTPVTAFAIDINTFGKKNGLFRAKLDNGDVVRSVFAPFPGVNSRGEEITTGQYLSYVSDTAISSFTIFTRGSRTFNLDSLVYSRVAPIPVPASLPLLLAGTAALFVLRKRRAKNV